MAVDFLVIIALGLEFLAEGQDVGGLGGDVVVSRVVAGPDDVLPSGDEIVAVELTNGAGLEEFAECKMGHFFETNAEVA